MKDRHGREWGPIVNGCALAREVVGGLEVKVAYPIKRYIRWAWFPDGSEFEHSDDPACNFSRVATTEKRRVP